MAKILTEIDRRQLLKASVSGALAATTATALASDEKALITNPRSARVTPFLTFIGNAEEAIDFYIGLFDDAKVEFIERYGQEEPDREGTVKVATFVLFGQRIMCIDSPAVHDWTFTPAISFFIDQIDEAKTTQFFQKLSEQGKIFMPLDEYPFSKKFGWVQDKFGVSWQLSAS